MTRFGLQPVNALSGICFLLLLRMGLREYAVVHRTNLGGGVHREVVRIPMEQPGSENYRILFPLLTTLQAR